MTMSRSNSLPEIVISTPTFTSFDIFQEGPGTPPHSKKRISIRFIIGIVVIVLICSGAVGYYIYSPLHHQSLNSESIKSESELSCESSNCKSAKMLSSLDNLTTVNSSSVLSEVSPKNETVTPVSVVNTTTAVPTTAAPTTPLPITTAPIVPTTTTPSLPIASNLCGKIPYSLSTAYQQYPNLRPAIDTLELYTIATWYTDNNPSALQEVKTLMQSCSSSSSLPVIVVYGLPNKDCSAGYSNMGSNKNTNDYINWLNNLVEATQRRQAVYILEPDALGLFAQGNSCAQSSRYIENIQIALSILSKTNSYIYLDIAHWALQSNDQQTRALNALTQMDPQKVLKGISLNVSNYRPTNEMSFLCNVVHNLGLQTGRNLHCAIDTSRNNNLVSDGNDWCNNQEAGIGQPPMKITNTNDLPYIDFFLWVKIPGESDGYCHNGPTAGQFSQELFTKLWNQSHFVKQLNAQSI